MMALCIVDLCTSNLNPQIPTSYEQSYSSTTQRILPYLLSQAHSKATLDFLLVSLRSPFPTTEAGKCRFWSFTQKGSNIVVNPCSLRLDPIYSKRILPSGTVMILKPHNWSSSLGLGYRSPEVSPIVSSSESPVNFTTESVNGAASTTFPG